MGALLEVLDFRDAVAHCIVNRLVCGIHRAIGRTKSRELYWLRLFFGVFSILHGVPSFVVLRDRIAFGVHLLDIYDLLALPSLLFFLKKLLIGLLFFLRGCSIILLSWLLLLGLSLAVNLLIFFHI